MLVLYGGVHLSHLASSPHAMLLKDRLDRLHMKVLKNVQSVLEFVLNHEAVDENPWWFLVVLVVARSRMKLLPVNLVGVCLARNDANSDIGLLYIPWGGRTEVRCSYPVFDQKLGCVKLHEDLWRGE